MNTEMTINRMRVSEPKPAKHSPCRELKPGDPAHEKTGRSPHDFRYVVPVIWNEVTGTIDGGYQHIRCLRQKARQR